MLNLFDTNLLETILELDERIEINTYGNMLNYYQLLGVKSRLLFDYIVPSYEPLHTQSKEYIINEIIDMMRQKGLI